MAFGVLTVISARSARAQTPTQIVTFAVNPLNVTSFAGTPTLTITTAVAGLNPNSVTLSTPRWNVTTNRPGATIT